MNKLCCIVLLSLVAIGVSAGEKEAKIKTLMEAQGLLEMFDSQLEMGKIQGEKMGQEMMSQMLSQINPNEEFQSRFQNAFNSFMGKMQAPWGAEEIVKVWGLYYGKNFSDHELDQLIEFYTSPIGKKEVAASKSALPEFSMHFQKLSEPIFQKATQEYITELKIVAKECNCQK
ncbi:DUF2059 domain-containing protein [Psychromonas aquimarina]|uniref:DUF2059 domain-containing protein n=1 Tax=Psychromonas aquimarina TaxID=444919 RepID=UPI000420239E|nr:DUF2059 domain-containing protein [Psychromonas aquimarina]